MPCSIATANTDTITKSTEQKPTTIPLLSKEVFYLNFRGLYFRPNIVFLFASLVSWKYQACLVSTHTVRNIQFWVIFIYQLIL